MKKLSVLCVTLALLTASIFSLEAQKVNSAMNDFTMDLNNAAINGAVNQNVYADAYIGKLIPALPPHLGVGFNTSLAQLNTGNLKIVTDELGINIPNKLFIPYFNADARVGGLFLPFDLGITFMKVPSLDLFGLSYSFLNYGVDLRIPILQQGIIAPHISLGLAYYKSEGQLALSKSSANFSTSYKINTFGINLQISKDFVFVTPFIGGRFLISDAENTYAWETGTNSGNDSTNTKFADIMTGHVYGGLAVNIFIVKITPSVTYDFMNKLWSGAISLRVQL